MKEEKVSIEGWWQLCPKGESWLISFCKNAYKSGCGNHAQSWWHISVHGRACSESGCCHLAAAAGAVCCVPGCMPCSLWSHSSMICEAMPGSGNTQPSELWGFQVWKTYATQCDLCGHNVHMAHICKSWNALETLISVHSSQHCGCIHGPFTSARCHFVSQQSLSSGNLAWTVFKRD